MQLLLSSCLLTVRWARIAAEKTGLLNWLEVRGRRRRSLLWLRTLFEIYRLDDLIKLDLCWWTFSAQDCVAAYLAGRPGARVFEYGSGASTIWLARRAAEVHSVEHDAEWVEVMRSRAAAFPSVTLHFVPPRPVRGTAAKAPSERGGCTGFDFFDYVRAIDAVPGLFDLIVIDGRSRAACLVHAQDRLAPGGLILFDDAGRSRYRSAIASAGLDVVETRGLTPCVPYPDVTSLLAHPAPAAKKAR